VGASACPSAHALLARSGRSPHIVRELPLAMNHSSNGSHRKLGASTLAVHAGEERQKAVNAITDPIVCAATYTFASTQAVIDYLEQKQEREEYGRYGNPGEKVVERKLAALENGEDAILYASGMAAMVGLLMSKLN